MKPAHHRPLIAFLKSPTVEAPIVTLLIIQLALFPLYGDTVIDTDTVIDNGGAVISGNGGRGIFVNSGNVTISDTTFVNFSTKGGDGSGGGAGMGGVIFVNDGAAITLNNVNLYGNTATGGRGGVGTTGGNLNGFTPAITGAVSNGSTGAVGESGSSADAYLNGGDGRDGYNGERGGNAINGVGGAGGNGGNGSDGSTVTLDNVSAAFDIAKSTFDTAGDQTQAGLYTSISATFASLAAAAAAGANAGGPTTVQLAPFYTTQSTFFAGLAAEAQGSVVQAAVDATFETAKLVALETTAFELGIKGNGGSGGAAGDGGDGSFGFGGGAGGRGGNGGDAASLGAAIGGAAGDGGSGGNGGFGAGGGKGGNVGTIGDDGPNADHAGDYGSGGSGGRAGFGGGVGADGDDHPDAPTQGGAGGAGMGGAIFIRDGGSVTITGNANFAGNNAKGGQGQATANDLANGDSGIGIGTDIFMMKGSSLTLDAGIGNTIRFSGSSGPSIADNSFASMNSAGGSSSIATGEGAGLEVRSGLVIFENENVYTGQTLISGGVLQAQDGEGISTESNINIAGGVLQSHGEFTRFTGTQSDRIQWTGSGGFAAAGGDLTVNLNHGTQLTWGQDSFVPDGSALIFGSTSATDDVHFQNDIDLGGGTRTVLVKANADNNDYAYLNGVLSNGGLVVGDADHDGVLVLTGANTFAGGVTVNNGTLSIGNGGSLNDNGAVTVNADGSLDISVGGDQTIGDLDGLGTISLGSGTLTINQAGNTTFSGVIEDGGLGDGTGGNVVKNLGGTLTLSGANTYTGNTDLNAGTIILDGSLESAQVTIASGSTLENNAGGFASGSTIINNGTLQQDSDDTVKKLVNTGTIDNSGSTLTADTYELNNGSVINVNLGTGEITSNGTVAINGTANAEKLTVGSGTTTLGSAERLNDSIVVQIDSGANLALGGDEKIGVLNGAGDLQNNGGLLTADSGSFGGVISGTGGLTKVTDGTLQLTGANTYTGATSIDDGTLELSGGGSLAGNVIGVSAGATLDNFNGGLASTATVTNDGTFNIAGVDDTIAELINTGTVAGTAKLTAANYRLNSGSIVNANLGTGTVDSNGTVALNGTSDAETVNVQTGTMTLGSAERLDDETNLTVSGGARLELGGDETIGTLDGAGNVDNNGGKLTADDGIFSGVIEGSGGLTKTSAGTLELSGVNTYTGQTSVEEGSLNLTGSLAGEKIDISSGALLIDENAGLTDEADVNANGTFRLGSAEKIDQLTGSGSVELMANRLTVNSGSFAGVVSGTGGLTKVSDGTLQLTGANTYTGSTEIDDGTLELSGGGSLAGNIINIEVGAKLDDLNGGLASTATVTNDGTFNIAGVDDTIAELINTGTVNGTAKLTAANYRLNSGSIVNANLGTGIVDSNGTVELNGTSDAETVNVQSGTMTLGSAERLDDETDLTVSGGAKLVMGGDETIGTLDGAGTVDNAGGRLTADDGIFSGVIEGSGGLTKTSMGALELSGANTYTGQTNVEEGTLNLTGSLAGEKIDISSGALLIDENAGLTDEADVNADGTFRLGSDEKIDQLTGTGSVELAANRLMLNSGSFGGVVSGTGGLDKASGGNLTLSGANTYTGSTNIDEGTVDLTGSLESGNVTVDDGARLNSRSGGLAATSILNNDGTVDIGATSDTVSIYNSTGTLLGTGTLTASNYNLNDGSNIEANLGAGTINTTGAVSFSGKSAAETVNVAAGSVFSLAGKGEQLNNAAEANIDGTLELLNGDETIRLLNGDGTIEAGKFDLIVTEGGNFGGTLNAMQLVSTGGVIQLKTGAVLNTGSVVSGTGGGFNLANGTTINSTNIIVENGSTITVNDGATLGGSGNLLVQNGGELDVSGGATVGANTIEVQGGGVLDLRDPYNLNYGLLTGGGFVNTNGGTFVNDRGETVGGFLTFSGDFVNRGNLAPGNSPGLIAINGDFTERGNLLSEISTTTPVTGHDQIRVGGDITLAPSSQLVVQAYRNARPQRGDVFQILADRRGNEIRVDGTFNSVRFDADGARGRGRPVDNAAVVFDVNTGQVVATGLNESDSEFADLGENRNQRSAAAALFDAAQVGDNQIDTSDPLVGTLARNVIDGSNVASDQLSKLIPVHLGGLADYAMGGDDSMSNLVRSRVSPLKNSDSRGGFAGYNRFRMTSKDDVEIDRNDGYVGADQVFGNGVRLGMLAHFSSGEIGHAYGSGDADGVGGHAYAEGSINPRTQVLAHIGGSSTDFSLRRRTQLGVATGDTDVSSFNTALGARYLLKESEAFSLMPHFILGYESASVEEFVERGTLDALHTAGYDSSRLHAEIGASAVWTKEIAGRGFAFELTAGLRQNLSDDEDELQATLVNDRRVSFPVQFAGDDETYFNIRTNASYQVFDAGAVYTGFEGLFGGDEAITNLNAGFGYSF